ncbi:C4-dicarboxylate ABC transporter substrate-binding protein [Marinomonas mediterranea]|jgi:TRAP-type C4-dicarboxylate transport system, periplasmic component|uniref:Extracellular solute-binding protein, family 7 n=1 Tax=Marinomonas mediterranea (strain ATCC 700492 / JCM 21426 / NBRC 103028 / MMB-1) TaxID=717774 RepID=F2JXD8_MARM1|nr:TRAP transporter substrate-binding protein [Marinomonas mediterranea]ADZ91838.1 Extracellular solute-binding protein, family 7 [Marinomonas mediterranea MMB-1]WCN13874.1 C4-dicarboxylate ABC transporter substrate-binding protein [Marinomonas mediterranea]WCN17930.1 C4-dicarboxylate ABC transporter substrate-binding protein [Marinomonas mediterranea MMB-1]
MKKLKANALALLAGTVLSTSALLPAQAFAEAEYTFKLHHMLPPMSNAQANFLKPWAEKIEKQSDGRIDIELYPAMQLGGKPPQLFDQARKGIADITWTVGGYTPGRFPKATAFELPFVPLSARITSMALQEYAETEMQDELKDVHVLALHTHFPGSFHSREKDIKTMEDLDGLKVRAPNKMMAGALGILGANTVFMPVPSMPSALSKGVIDVTALPFEVVKPLKIHELAPHHTEFKGDRGFYTQFFIFSMNKKAYNSLPDDLKKVIDQNSGVPLAGFIGDAFDAYEIGARKDAVDRGNTFSTIEGAEYDRWKETLAPVTEKWIEDMNDDGYDAERLLEKAKTLIKKYENF